LFYFADIFGKTATVCHFATPLQETAHSKPEVYRSSVIRHTLF